MLSASGLRAKPIKSKRKSLNVRWHKPPIADHFLILILISFATCYHLRRMGRADLANSAGLQIVNTVSGGKETAEIT
jgi:hypothetical protein